MAPGKFQGDIASLGQTLPEAVALGLCHSSASQSLTLPSLRFNRDGKLSQKKWISPHSSEATPTPDTVRMCAFSLTSPHLNWVIKEGKEVTYVENSGEL